MILLPQPLACENYTDIPPSWLLFNITHVLALILWKDSVVGRGLVRLGKHSRSEDRESCMLGRKQQAEADTSQGDFKQRGSHGHTFGLRVTDSEGSI